MNERGYDWDADEGEWPFRARTGPGGRDAVAVVVSNDEADVPAVRDAARHGLEPLPSAPLWCFLPVLWPREHRFWTPDLRARTASAFRIEGESLVESSEEPWSAADYAMCEQDANGMLESCGLAPRPNGRIWLLRTPDGSPLDAFLGSLLESAERARIEPTMSPDLVEFVRDELGKA